MAQLESELKSYKQAASTPEKLLELLEVTTQIAELDSRLQEAEYQKQQALLERETAVKTIEAQKKFETQLHTQLSKLGRPM